MKRVGILLVLFAGLIPLLWLRIGFIIGNGDNFPFWLNSQTLFAKDVYLWSLDAMGHADQFPAYFLYNAFGFSLINLGFSLDIVQIFVQLIFFMGAGLSMYYFSSIIYPNFKIAHVISAIFYMFNFFVMQTRLNTGFVWTYAFLPLLMALLLKCVDAACNKEKANKTALYFALTSTVAFSFASINPANIVLILICLFVVLFYYVLIYRSQIRSILQVLLKITLVSVPLNLWWLFPMLNYYLWSPGGLDPQISIAAWSWTQDRASILNLFWLNGVWNWSPEYFPYYNSFSNPFLVILTFVPFVLAAIALLFRSNKSKFNLYVMFSILIFMFLAKGVHEPLSQLNLMLYNYLPGMTMFREPTTKFTMIIMPFLALLIGFAVEKVTQLNIRRIRFNRLSKILLVTLFISVLVIAAFPILTNPIETKTEELPFSSYVQIPEYWYQSADWLNNQEGDFKVLITPPDDFYQMPYVWGYYGTDTFLSRLIIKPLISPGQFSYKTDPEVVAVMEQIQSTIEQKKTTDFKDLLDILNIKYILQRNDIQYDFNGRCIVSPEDMRSFLNQQSYIRLVKEFGQLDIYEYTEAKPYLYLINASYRQQNNYRFENETNFEKAWNFSSSIDASEWLDATPQNHWQSTYTVANNGDVLRAELWDSTQGWKTINSPLIPSQPGNIFQVQIDIRGENANQVHLKMMEYDENNSLIHMTYISYVNDGSFDWMRNQFEFKPTMNNTKYVQLQIWHGYEIQNPLPSVVLIDNVKIAAYTAYLNTNGIDLFQAKSETTAMLLNYEKISPTQLTIKVNATAPFIIVLSEALDSSWTAEVNGEKIKPISVLLCTKGFQVNQTGILDINIKYDSQSFFFYCCLISFCTTFFSIIYLIIKHPRTKPLFGKIKKVVKGA